MDRRYLFFYVGLGFWLLALVAWFTHAATWTLVSGSLAVVSFLFHGLRKQVFNMFGKNKTSTELPQVNVVTPPVPVEKPLPTEEKQNNTVISSDVRFEGNLTATGQVYIYGEVYGNIDASNGMVKVMRNGLVQGNISSRELIIDGVVNGECKSETIDIDVHGNVNGALSYASLSVKKGGIFVGKAENFAKPENKTNVVGLVTEKKVTAIETSPELSEESSDMDLQMKNKKRR